MDSDTEAHRNNVTVHSGGVSARLYVCTVCEKMFTTKQYFARIQVTVCSHGSSALAELLV